MRKSSQGVTLDPVGVCLGALWNDSDSWGLLPPLPVREIASTPVANLPIWAFHGENDTISPVSNTREPVARLRKLGSNVLFTELHGVGHDSDRFVYSNAVVYQ